MSSAVTSKWPSVISISEKSGFNIVHTFKMTELDFDFSSLKQLSQSSKSQNSELIIMEDKDFPEGFQINFEEIETNN